MRPEYLEWSVVHNGILSTRELFVELKDIKPECKRLYITMISYELTQNTGITKLKTIRKLYNDVCNAFGQTDIGEYQLLLQYYQSLFKIDYTGVWSDCIRFEYKYGSRKLVKEIYKASLLCLEPSLRNGMTKEFEKLKHEFVYV